MKIYIIGPSGSGKTTLAKHLSNKYKINRYELDCIVYDDENNHTRRNDEEIKELFDNIINKDSWIIEDVGRSKFIDGREKADTIYYLDISKHTIYKRVIKRWIKQRLGKEDYNYPPTLFQFYDMIRIAHNYIKKQPQKRKSLEKYKNKVKYLEKKELDKLLKK